MQIHANSFYNQFCFFTIRSRIEVYEDDCPYLQKNKIISVTGRTLQKDSRDKLYKNVNLDSEIPCRFIIHKNYTLKEVEIIIFLL